MSTRPLAQRDDGTPRCGACGAPRDGGGPAAPTPPDARVPPPAPVAAPAGTHCEWCGAEFPDGL